jgi:hypothetical protein
MPSGGYVQLRRGILDHRLPPTRFAALVLLILEADAGSGTRTNGGAAK